MPHRLHPPGFLLAACAAIAMLSLTLGTIGPLLPRFDAEMDSGVYTGLVIAGHPLGSLVAAIPTLLASRRFGLPRTIATGAAIGFAASILFVWPGSGWWIVLARFGYGVCATVVWQSVFAWAITNTGPGRRARTMGTLMAAGTVGGLAAPQLGALADDVGVWLCAVPPAFLLLAAARFVPLPAYEMLARPDLDRLRSAVLSTDGRGGAVLTAASAVVGLGVSVALPLRLHQEGVGAFGIGAVLTLAAASAVVVNPLAGRAVDLGRTRPLLVGAFGLLTAALAGFALAPSAAVAVPLAYVCTVLPWIPNLAGATLSSRAFGRAEVDQTVSQTLTTLAWAPAAVLGSFGAGAIHSPRAALLTLAAGAALGATGLAVELAQHRRPLPVWR